MPERARIYRLRQGRPSVAQSQERRPQEPLWREVLGQRLRALRLGQRETLAGALGITLIRLTEQVAGELRRQQGIGPSRASGPVMLAMAA